MKDRCQQDENWINLSWRVRRVEFFNVFFLILWLLSSDSKCASDCAQQIISSEQPLFMENTNTIQNFPTSPHKPDAAPQAHNRVAEQKLSEIVVEKKATKLQALNSKARIEYFPELSQTSNTREKTAYEIKVQTPKRRQYTKSNTYNNTSTPIPNTRRLQQFLCDSAPVLSAQNPFQNYTYDESIAKILGILKAFSPVELFRNPHTAQYKAACWIIFDDEMKLTASDTMLVERYSLAVFLFHFERFEEFSAKSFCEYDERRIKCNSLGEIIGLTYG